MDKVKVSREVAEELDKITKPAMLIHQIATSEPIECIDRFGNLTFDELIRALYIGYEVNETPVEKFNYFFDKYSQSDIMFEKDFLGGMLAVAKWFDLPVKGREE
ncbi:hypothetical protein MHB65_06905 [Lysinibacillus sp. FSL K6-0075]|uniref:hypothetical protein n=1 Tax=Lysinibacillus sp. FSL K6-0075 TaxID=2921415 RepID=UPI003158679E